MLRQRVLTALLLLPAALGIILFAPLPLLDLVVGAVLFWLAWEYAGLCGFGLAPRIAHAALVVSLFALAVLPWTAAATLADVVTLAAAATWLLVPFWLWRRTPVPALLKGLVGVLLLAGTGLALHGLKLAAADGRWLLMAFVIVWAADIGAYAAGRLWGRRKLAPAISPGKTLEGVAGGVALVLLCGAVASALIVAANDRLAWMLLLLPLTFASVVGDLFESLLKRQAGVKDSGALLPGHGGLLDRLDSLLAVAPLLLVSGKGIGIFGELSSWGP